MYLLLTCSALVQVQDPGHFGTFWLGIFEKVWDLGRLGNTYRHLGKPAALPARLWNVFHRIMQLIIC